MTDDERRPDPEALLRAIHAEESQALKGRLRIFLGMSAGVGKTFAMLRAAQQKHQEGVDVWVGVVETHGRQETAAMLEGLKILPRKKITYKGTELEEMDLDKILEIRPELVLVDELAHTNVPGSRHEKRYQDVIELLDQGIDVYTTINVQHFESRKEAVEAITQISIRETVPDSLLDRAHLVEVVDIAPSELLKRLQEGKVYLGDRAERAAQNFFKQDRLTALREIALRLVAERVDHELQQFGEMKFKQGPWQTNERLMVAVSHSPYSERLIRATRRLAYSLEAPWIAVHVDDGTALSNEDQAQLARNINLSRELRAEVVTTIDTDIASALERIARQKNVTQLVVGRPSRRHLKDFVEGGTLLDRLVRESQSVDVHVIRQERTSTYQPSFFRRVKTLSGFLSYWYTLWAMAGVIFFGVFLNSWIGYRAVGFIFLLGVLVVGLVTSMGPTIFAAVLSSFAWNFLFIPPQYTFVVDKPEDIIMILTYFIVATIMGYLANRVKFHEKLIREREDRTNVLYEVSQDISSSREKREFLKKVTERMGRLLEGECGVLLKSVDGNLQTDEDKAYGISLSEKEKAVAVWAFQSGKMAGWSTETLNQSTNLYLPLRSSSDILGIFVYRPFKVRKLSIEQENLLHSVARQLAISLEKHFFERRLREAEKLQESEELHQTLLNSISHELRTPLTVVMASATTMTNPEIQKNPAMVETIGQELLGASDRLNRVIENLLDMSRLNSGVLSLKLEWHDIRDLIGVVTQKMKVQLQKHELELDLDEKLPMIRMDFRLMEHALSNLLQNAVMYTPPETKIRIRAISQNEKLFLSVEDEGSGIPKDSLEKVFQKFYRVPGSPAGGTGLGLSIVKSIVEAHKGQVIADNRPEGGAIFRIELPIQEMTDIPQEEKEQGS